MNNQSLDEMMAQCVEEGDCLLWQGRLTSTGHPRWCGGGLRLLVRRALWESMHGWLPEDSSTVITTNCLQPLCVNRAHLVCMSRSKLVKRSYGKRNMAAEYGKRQLAAVRSGKTKLSLDVARQIRCDERTTAEIAAALGVSESLISKIRARVHWKEPAGVFSGLMPR